LLVHNPPVIDISIGKYYIPIYTFSDFYTDSGLFDESQIGDSIFKNANSLIFCVKRGLSIKCFNVSPLKEYWVNPYYEENCSKLPSEMLN